MEYGLSTSLSQWSTIAAGIATSFKNPCYSAETGLDIRDKLAIGTKSTTQYQH